MEKVEDCSCSVVMEGGRAGPIHHSFGKGLLLLKKEMTFRSKKRPSMICLIGPEVHVNGYAHVLR